jgi:glutathionyl-hydroquinone reductase
MNFFTRQVQWKFAKLKTWVWNGINNGLYKQGNVKKTKIFLGFQSKKQVTMQP